MNITVEVKDVKGNINTFSLSSSYLVKFVEPAKMYPVSYQIKNSKRVNEPCYLKGEDLSQNQIAELFAKRLL